MKPTKKTALKIVELLGYGLTKGMGKPEPGQMCVEALVCYVLGQPHGDNPSCVGPAVRSFKIALNDSNWSNNQSRAKGMSRIALAQLGSDSIDQNLFVKELTLSIVRKLLPLTLETSALIQTDLKHKQTLLQRADECKNVSNLKEAESASRAASSASWAASRAASSASRAASSASWAASAASSASWAASAASRAASAASAASRAARAASAASDKILSMVAEMGVQALIKCKSPGCKWLSLIKN